jgi:hypothetical protein
MRVSFDLIKKGIQEKLMLYCLFELSRPLKGKFVKTNTNFKLKSAKYLIISSFKS